MRHPRHIPERYADLSDSERELLAACGDPYVMLSCEQRVKLWAELTPIGLSVTTPRGHEPPAIIPGRCRKSTAVVRWMERSRHKVQAA